MANPKVLVGCPTYSGKSYCLEEYAKRVNGLSYDNYDVLLVDNSKEPGYEKQIQSHGLQAKRDQYIPGVKKRLAQSRNILRQKVLDEGYDYFLSLEQDVIPPKNIIERLMSHRRAVTSAVYCRYQTIKTETGDIFYQGDVPVLYVLPPKDKMRPIFLFELKGHTFIKINGAGLGCLLIHRSVLEKIEFRVEDPARGCDDNYFFKDLASLNVEAFADVTFQCKHLEQKWSDEIKKS
ncbi:glycosyltransferase [Alteromonas sediminis]|uniref:Glycosyltransferase n=1 Tax=Alteromonas sediminis TaxID=2259342 RepID=A0A3N5ZE52_9ALTE|nr:glycosyltransferase [Alteromonas sediminis]RPJ68568.1 glycosyltransferase [Alteromonas sediminis]